MYLEGLRIIIRDFTLQDTNDVFSYCSKDNIGPSAGWKPHESKEITRNVLIGYMYSKETFAIMLKANHKVIGNISLYHDTLRKKIKAADIGFVLNEEYWGNGYMTEAVKLMLDYAFGQEKLEIVGVGHHYHNKRSRQTILNCGFTFEGLFRKYRKLYDNKEIDAVMYSMTKEEYERNKEKWEKN